MAIDIRYIEKDLERLRENADRLHYFAEDAHRLLREHEAIVHNYETLSHHYSEFAEFEAKFDDLRTQCLAGSEALHELAYLTSKYAEALQIVIEDFWIGPLFHDPITK